MSIVIFLLIAIVILLCTPQTQRLNALWGLIFMGGLIWIFVNLEIGAAKTPRQIFQQQFEQHTCKKERSEGDQLTTSA